jgi:hypothetical protein
MRPIHYLFVSYLFTLVSCAQYHYSPNLIQTPYIDQKDDLEVSAALLGGSKAVNMDFRLAYSPMKHATVMLNYFRFNTSYENSNFFGGPTYKQFTKGQFLEAAVGTYTRMGFGSGSVYLGWGRGSTRNDFGIERISELQVHRVFIQPTYTFQNDWFRIGMGVRVVRLSFPSGQIDYRIEPNDIRIIERLERESPFWIPEFGGNMGVHFKPFTFYASMVLVPTRDTYETGFDNSNIGVGITVELQDIFKRGVKTKKAPAEEPGLE